jgi:replicative DNA helicase
MATKTKPPKNNDAPHSVEAEEAVLGSILLNPDALIEIDPPLTVDDFFIVRNGWVWEAFMRLRSRNEEIDNVTVVEELKQQERLDEIGGSAYITHLINHTPSSIYTNTYRKILERATIRRKMLKAASKIAQLAHEESDSIDKTIELVMNALHEVTVPHLGLSNKTIGEAIALGYNHTSRAYEGKDVGIPTGYSDLDRILGGGVNKGDLVVTAGRPGMGKTAMAVNWAWKAALAGYKIGLISFEMPVLSIGHRYTAMVKRINLKSLRNGRDMTDDDWIKLNEAVEINETVWLEDQARPRTFATVKAIAELWIQTRGLDMLIVDHLHLMTGGIGDNKVDRLASITSGLKDLAMLLNIPIVLLAQLNREVENRKDKHPTLADLRGSGGIEEDADIVMLLTRPEYYDANTSRKNQVDVDVAKHRNGSTGRAVLHFEAEYTRFSDIAGYTQYDYSGDFWAERFSHTAFTERD